MSLDSVELVMEIEKFFEIEIPDADAERMNTPKIMAQLLMKQLSINTAVYDLEAELFDAVSKAFTCILEVPQQTISPTTPLKSIFPNTDQEIFWLAFKAELGLETPIMQFDPLAKGIKYKWLQFFTEPLRLLRLDDTITFLVTCIAIKNYHFLINPKEIRSLFEIKTAIMGITCARFDIEPSHIHENSFFTTDLGID